MKNILLGVITRPFGLRGEMRVKPFNPRTTWFETAKGCWLCPPGGAESELSYFPILHARWHKDRIVLALEGVRDRTQAEELQGFEVLAREDQLSPLEEGEYYWYQLVGLRVETTRGETVGQVTGLAETAPELDGNDVLIIATAGGEVLVPMAAEAIARIDLAERKIIIEPHFAAKS